MGGVRTLGYLFLHAVKAHTLTASAAVYLCVPLMAWDALASGDFTLVYV